MNGYKPAVTLHGRYNWLHIILCSFVLIGIIKPQTGAGKAFLLQDVSPLALDAPQIYTTGTIDGEVVWGDVDNDNDQDLLMTGRDDDGTKTILFRNNNGILTENSTAMPGVEFGSLALGDFDCDGDLDVFITGQSGISNKSPIGLAEIYRNNGSGSFTLHQELTGIYRSSGDWGDYDNDGDLDLLIAGYRSGGSGFGALYRNDSGVFTEETSVNIPDVGDSYIRWGDFDADDDQDFVIMGKPSYDAPTSLTQIFSNNGVGSFNISNNLIGLWSGAASWVDIENDGDLDLLLNGNAGPSKDNFILISRFYRYSNGSFNQVTTNLPGVWQSSVSWGDYDNDGDADLLLNGLASTGNVTKVYTNNNGNFTDAQANLRSGTGASVTWGHLDNDNNLDLVVTGVRNNDQLTSTYVYHNNPSVDNTLPTSSTLTSACWDSGNRVYLNWSDASDAQTTTGGLTYSLRIGTGPGLGNIANPSAATNGWRRLSRPGNSFSESNAVIRLLPTGSYYWSVQAVDSAYVGGPFSANGTFNVGTRIAQDDTGYVVNENNTIDIPVLANDLAGYGSLVIHSVENPAHGTSSINGSEVHYVPDPNFSGVETFGYYARTSQGYCSRAIVSVSVVGISLSNRTVPEGQGIGTTVGTFSTTSNHPGETFTYTLVSGDGSQGNSSFTISGSNLRTAVVFNYQTQNSYSIRVRSVGSQGTNIQKVFTISIISPPSDIELSPADAPENQPINTTIGTFTTTDVEPGSTFTYSLVSGSGSTDNSSFNISGSQLRNSVVFDYETINTYSIRVRSTDNGGLWYEEAFTINILDTAHAPTDIVLSNNMVPEGKPSRTRIGIFTTIDPDSDQFRYMLVNGTGSDDNSSFMLYGSELWTGRVLIWQPNRPYSIRIRSEDYTDEYREEVFTIIILDNTYLPVIQRRVVSP